MDIAKSAGVVFGVVTVSGIIISILSSQLQCSKISVVTSLKQGAFSAILPSIVYFLAVYFPMIRNPFSHTLSYFGINELTSQIVGVGYLVMLTSWITTVWNIHNTEKAVCVPDLNEMTEFKKKLLAELEAKQIAEEKNKEATIK